MLRRKHIAFLIVYGAEVRAFLHSGLIKKLAEKYDVSIITTHPESKVFDHIDYATVHKMPIVRERQLLARIRAWTRRSHQAWLQKKQFSTWRHFFPTQTALPLPLYRRLWHSVFQQANWYRFWRVLENLVARFWGTQESWRQLLAHLDIDCLVVAPLKGETILPALQTARHAGCKIVNITNSWKDIYVSSHISVVPDKTIMPSDASADFLLAVNPHISPSKVSVSTSLYFEKIIHPDNIFSRQQFCTSMGLDPQRSYICYTSASPLAVTGELEIVRELLLMLKDQPSQPQLLLRQNPMDDSSQFCVLQNEYPQILVVHRPNWEWNHKEDWMCAFEDDVKLWFNTIYHSVCNISIPSTVTMEFAALKKPVINICFDLDENVSKERSISRFWDAPYYDEVKQSNYAIPTFSLADLNKAIQCVIEGQSEVKETSFFPTLFPVEHVFNQIEAAMKGS